MNDDGFGRTGTLFAHEQAGVRPDFLLSKGLTGGDARCSSVVLSTDAVYASFYDDAVKRGFLHSHSYTGNPLACRAVLGNPGYFRRGRRAGPQPALCRAVHHLAGAAGEPSARAAFSPPRHDLGGGHQIPTIPIFAHDSTARRCNASFCCARWEPRSISCRRISFDDEETALLADGAVAGASCGAGSSPLPLGEGPGVRA